MRTATAKERLYWLCFAILTVVGCVRIVTASAAYFETADEPLHVACGMWWFDGLYPPACIDQAPLARAVAAAPLYFRGVRAADPETGIGLVGTSVFRSRGGYERNLALARAAILPFFLLASFLVWIWARRLYGYPSALAAVFLFQSLPPVLAHAGLVTTDMALTACLAFAFFTLVLWLENPSRSRSALLGLSVGLAVASKHSGFPYFAAAAALIVGVWGVAAIRKQGWSWAPVWKRLARCGLGVIVAFFVVWASYRFSLISLSRPDYRPHAGMARMLHVDGLLARSSTLQAGFNRLLEMPVPAGELARGLAKVGYRDGVEGRWSYFMGEVRHNGWRLFFPTLIAVKSPIPFLILALTGLLVSLRPRARAPLWERLAPTLGIAGILAVAIPAPINIGVRHVLPVYPLLAILAGAGLVGFFQAVKWRAFSRAVGVLLVAWFVVSSAAAHPDYLPYFNEFARGHGENIAIDSDLDWNQDVKRLTVRLRELGAEKLWIHCNGCQYLTYHDIPPIPGAPPDVRYLKPYEPVEGWIAVSEWTMRVRVVWERIVARRTDGPWDWLERYPWTRIGTSLRLYYVPPRAGATLREVSPATTADPRRAASSPPRTAPSS